MSDLMPWAVVAEGFVLARFASQQQAQHFIDTSPIFTRPGRVVQIIRDGEDVAGTNRPTAWARILDDDPLV